MDSPSLRGGKELRLLEKALDFLESRMRDRCKRSAHKKFSNLVPWVERLRKEAMNMAIVGRLTGQVDPFNPFDTATLLGSRMLSKGSTQSSVRLYARVRDAPYIDRLRQVLPWVGVTTTIADHYYNHTTSLPSDVDLNAPYLTHVFEAPRHEVDYVKETLLSLYLYFGGQKEDVELWSTQVAFVSQKSVLSRVHRPKKLDEAPYALYLSSLLKPHYVAFVENPTDTHRADFAMLKLRYEMARQDRIFPQDESWKTFDPALYTEGA